MIYACVFIGFKSRLAGYRLKVILMIYLVKIVENILDLFVLCLLYYIFLN